MAIPVARRLRAADRACRSDAECARDLAGGRSAVCVGRSRSRRQSLLAKLSQDQWRPLLNCRQRLFSAIHNADDVVDRRVNLWRQRWRWGRRRRGLLRGGLRRPGLSLCGLRGSTGRCRCWCSRWGRRAILSGRLGLRCRRCGGTGGRLRRRFSKCLRCGASEEGDSHECVSQLRHNESP